MRETAQIVQTGTRDREKAASGWAGGLLGIE
jgi:hypothetical protein